MKSKAELNDAALDALLAEAFDSLKAPEEAKDAVRSALADAEQPDRGFVLETSRNASASKPRSVKVRRFARYRAAAAVAACLVLGALGFGGYSAWADVVAVVGIDINPSIEISLNRFDRVVEARGLNEDGASLLAKTPVEGMCYEEALFELMGSAEIQEAGSAGENPVTITVVPMDGSDASAYVDGAVSAAQGTGCAYVCGSATRDEYEEARSSGLTVGKYRVFRELCDLGVDIDEEQAAEMTMRQLRDLLESQGGDPSSLFAGHRYGGGADGSAQGSGEGNGSGDGSGRGEGAGHGNGFGKGNGDAAGGHQGEGRGIGSTGGRGNCGDGRSDAS